MIYNPKCKEIKPIDAKSLFVNFVLMTHCSLGWLNFGQLLDYRTNLPQYFRLKTLNFRS